MRTWHWLAIGAAAILFAAWFFAFGGMRVACDSTGAFCPQAVETPIEPAPGYSLDDVTSEEATQFEDIEPAEVVASAPRPAPRAPARAAEPVVMQQVVGVGPEETESADEEVVIQGRRYLRPQWTRTPSGNRIAQAYPERALERGWEGEASVSCVVQDNGNLDCTQVSQTPDNSGFGLAAVRVARTYNHGPELEDGQPAAGAVVNFRILFRIAEVRRRGSPSTGR
jgi:TonB family protein